MRKPDGKIVLLGDMNVGKTSLLQRYMERRFPDTVSTVGGAFYLKQWRSFNISIWDTAGEGGAAGTGLPRQGQESSVGKRGISTLGCDIHCVSFPTCLALPIEKISSSTALCASSRRSRLPWERFPDQYDSRVLGALVSPTPPPGCPPLVYKAALGVEQRCYYRPLYERGN